MLSRSVAAVAVPVAPHDPPPVITLHAANTITDVWDFEGTVTDNGDPVAGLKVCFGGVLAKYHLTATVEENGTYDVTRELRNLVTGTGTAQTRDAAGKASNVAMAFIDSEYLGRRRCPAGFLIPAEPADLAPRSPRSPARRATRATAERPPTPR